MTSQAIDVSDVAAMKDFAASTNAQYGHIDAMINNAGMVSRGENFLEMAEAYNRLGSDANYGASTMAAARLPLISPNGPRPHSSMWLVTERLYPSAAHILLRIKAAVVAYTEVLRQELSGSKATITLMCQEAPKPILAEMFRSFTRKKGASGREFLALCQNQTG